MLCVVGTYMCIPTYVQIRIHTHTCTRTHARPHTHTHARTHTQKEPPVLCVYCMNEGMNVSLCLSQCLFVDFDISSHFVEKVRPRTSSTSDAEVKRQPANSRERAQTQAKGKGGKKGLLPTSKSRGPKQPDSQQRHTTQVIAIHTRM